MRRSFLSFINPRNEYEDIIKTLVDRLEKYENEDRSDKIIYLENENKSLKNDIKELFSVIIKTGNDEHAESFICKKSDLFKTIEEQFYDLHSEYRDKPNIHFKIGKNEIIREKTLEQNKIRKNAKILLLEKEE